MGGRGTYAAGNNVAYTYETIGKINDIKVLKGLGNNHSLPAEAHSSSAYIKLKPDGTFHEMRIYGKDKYTKFEIGYHHEPKLGKGNVLHFHMIDKDFKRTPAAKLHKNSKLYKEFKKYFKGVK